MPIDFDDFDFDLLFKLNCSIPALLKATNARLRKIWPELAYLAFHEFQRRMAVHVNLIYRVPHDDKLDATVLEEVIKGVTTRAYWAGSEPTDDVAWGSVEVQTLETAEVIDGNWFEARKARLATETGKPDRTIKTVDDAIGYGAKDLTSGRPWARGKARGAFLARLSEVAESTPCPNCFEKGQPEFCSSNFHREFGRSSNTFSCSAFRGRTSGWSPHHLTLGALREERKLLGRMAGSVRRGECEPDFNLIERIFHGIASSGSLGGVMGMLTKGPVRDHDRWLTSSRARLIEGVVTYDDDPAEVAETAEVATTAEPAETAVASATAETAEIERRWEATGKSPLNGALAHAKGKRRAVDLRTLAEVNRRFAGLKSPRAPPRTQAPGLARNPGGAIGPKVTVETCVRDGARE
ncbi:hypothetical protein BKA03_002537 [Demequina lutea]|uniref:Uncharacterized protein n=1 Tax=Demequina lutea TaxID=431489 RepID=A0A7Z0CKZ9_9MICO|nr:hypothetical protein [Demequina lutea]NYI42418.1 hypothetical protein [Demequina lutea]